MKISEASLESLFSLTPNEKWELVCGETADCQKSCQIGLLLGGKPKRAVYRAHAAAKLYHEGRVSYIVPSGGVIWEYEGVECSEAELMTKILLEDGVPKEAIIMENEAQTTRENMIYGTLRINRKTKFKGIDEVLIITSFWHMKRSLALAKTFLPRKVTPCAYPVFPSEDKDTWLLSDENRERLEQEIKIMKGLVTNNLIDDFEIPKG